MKNADMDQKFMGFTEGMSFMGEGFKNIARGSYILLFGLSANIIDKVSGIGSSDQRFKDVLRVLGSILLVLPVATLLTVTVLPMLAVVGFGTLRNAIPGKQKKKGLLNRVQSTGKEAVKDVQVQAGRFIVNDYVQNKASSHWKMIYDPLFDKKIGLFRRLVGKPGPELSSHREFGESSSLGLEDDRYLPEEAGAFDIEGARNSGVDKQQLGEMLQSILDAENANAATAAIKEYDSSFGGAVNKKDLNALKVFAKNIQLNISKGTNIRSYRQLEGLITHDWGSTSKERNARKAPFDTVNRVAKACYPDKNPGEKSENKSLMGRFFRRG